DRAGRGPPGPGGHLSPRLPAPSRNAVARNPEAAREDSGDAAGRQPGDRDRRNRESGPGGQAHHRDARIAAMSSPDHDPKVAATEVGGAVPKADEEVINV